MKRDRSRDEARRFIHEASRDKDTVAKFGEDEARTADAELRNAATAAREEGMLEEKEFLTAPRGFSRRAGQPSLFVPRLFIAYGRPRLFLQSSRLSFLLLPFTSPSSSSSRFITADEPLTLFSREDIRRDHIFRHDPVFSLAFSVSPRVHATCTIKDAIMTRERTRERREHCV